MRKLCRYPLRTAIALATIAMGFARPAAAQITSLSFKGFNYVSYYNGSYANADSLPALAGTGADAVALAFEYGIDVQNSAVYADANYTEVSSVIAATVAEANSRGLNVMVRPLIDFLDPSKIGSYSVGDWRSTYNPSDVAAFFASYKTMIVAMAQLSQANGAASLSIGVELDQLTGPAYQSYWTDIITAVRAVFSGKLTYSSEWDDNISPWQGQHGLTAGTGDLTTQVSFWSQLDYLGIDCYAPISDASSPTVAQLVAGWTQTPTVSSTLSTTGNQSLISYFASVATQTGLPLIFTEIGYESASDAAAQPFATSTHVYDPALQANLYTAFFEAWQQSGNNALTGVYFWNWDPNAAEVGPSQGPNFSPQGESAQTVVTANFGTAGPALQVTSATSIFASGNQGGTFSPASFAYQLKATSGSVGYSISGVPSWLTASSTSGTVSTSATTITFSINASAATLSPASYAAMITFTDTTNSDTAQTISAALTVDGTYLLSVSVSGNGTVTSAPAGIACGSACSASFATGTQVSLDAAPGPGASFSGWTGACSGNSGCVVAMGAAVSVSATFSTNGGGGQSGSKLYVNPETGADTGSCAQTAPCQTLNFTLAQATAGSVIEIETGGTFGPIYLDQPVVINGPADGSAAIVWSNTLPGCIGGDVGSCDGSIASYAVEIAAGATNGGIEINNLVIDNGAGTNGALHVASAYSVSMTGTVLRGGTGAIPQIMLVDSAQNSPMELFFSNCDVGFSSSGGGVLVAPTSATPVTALFQGGEVHSGLFGVKFDATGLNAGAKISAEIDRTKFFSFTNSAVTAKAGSGGSAEVLLSRSTIENAGSSAFNVNGGNALGLLFKSTITGNQVGVAAASGATAYSFGNNEIFGNSTNVTGSLTTQTRQ